MVDELFAGERAKGLVAAYVVEGGEKQVNLPAEMAKTVAKKVEDSSKPLDGSLFDATRAEVYNLMKRDTLPRFRETPRFDELLASSVLAGEPTPIPACDVPASFGAAKAALASQAEGMRVSMAVESISEPPTPKGKAAAGVEYRDNYESPSV